MIELKRLSGTKTFYHRTGSDITKLIAGKLLIVLDHDHQLALLLGQEYRSGSGYTVVDIWTGNTAQKYGTRGQVDTGLITPDWYITREDRSVAFPEWAAINYGEKYLNAMHRHIKAWSEKHLCVSPEVAVYLNADDINDAMHELYKEVTNG